MLALGIYLILAALATTGSLSACWLGSRTGAAEADRYFETINRGKAAWTTPSPA